MTNDIVRFTNDEIKQLCELVVRKDRVEAADWAEQNPSWQTFKEVIRAGNGKFWRWQYTGWAKKALNDGLLPEEFVEVHVFFDEWTPIRDLP